MARHTLGRDERLKSRKRIAELFKSGKAFNIFPFRVVYLLAENPPLLQGIPFFKGREQTARAGFSVSTRNFKKAVDRNRIKRLIKESYRMQKRAFAETLQKKGKTLDFFFIFTGKELPTHDFIENKMKAVIEKLEKIINESAS